ncbi:hypothetical protein MVEN_02590700 [Mycena venus]|uniref:BTB domain-containing protein n=1 Tax=Mycena venus TaxID=2733690 RepID=A0A8H6U3L5_9AGAR|nr:hypothetical protein MVEN_02590700 [Mycena venus]
MTDPRTTLQGVKPHDKYYLDGGDLHIIAEDREFRVHRYFFERDSVKFRGLLASPSPGQPRQGSSQLTAINLGVAAKDFEKFLWVFYNPTYSLYDTTVSDWTCILHLGHEWQFAEVEKLAVRELEKMPMSIVDRIALYQKHKVSEDLLIAHYAALCTRGFPLDLDESERLGMSAVVLINQVMHSIHTPWDADGNSSPVNPINAAVISKISAHIEQRRTTNTGTVSAGQSVPATNSTNAPQKRSINGVNGPGGKPGQANGKN